MPPAYLVTALNNSSICARCRAGWRCTAKSVAIGWYERYTIFWPKRSRQRWLKAEPPRRLRGRSMTNTQVQTFRRAAERHWGIVGDMPPHWANAMRITGSCLHDCPYARG